MELLEAIKNRRSIRRYRPDPLDERMVEAVLEAARWAPSCFNEQPWNFLVATRDDPDRFDRLSRCLVPANRAWAGNAPVLMLAVARKTFTRNGKPNAYAEHDVWLAIGFLMLLAEAQGLSVHAMAGFDRDQARTVLEIPDDHEALTMLAVGYRGDPSTLGEDLAARERAARERRPMEDFVFGDRWGTPL